MRVHAGRLCRRLRVLHERPRRPRAPVGQRRDRRAGGAGAVAPTGEQGRVHGNGRAGTQPRRGRRGDRLPRHRGRDRAQEPRVLDGRRFAGVRAAAPRTGEAGAGAVAALDVRRQARAAAAAGTAARSGRTRRPGRELRPRHRLSDPVPVDAARRRQRRRRRDRRHRAPARRQVRGDEPDSVERGRRRRVPPPAVERVIDIARALLQRGVLAKLRDSAGQDVDGGCGQLRARAIVPRAPSGGRGSA